MISYDKTVYQRWPRAFWGKREIPGDLDDIANYARLSAPSLLPPSITNVIMLDSDTVVKGSICELHDMSTETSSN
jgi:lipopolysaccharide biosynthesis glycosyltransferase